MGQYEKWTAVKYKIYIKSKWTCHNKIILYILTRHLNGSLTTVIVNIDVFAIYVVQLLNLFCMILVFKGWFSSKIVLCYLQIQQHLPGTGNRYLTDTGHDSLEQNTPKYKLTDNKNAVCCCFDAFCQYFLLISEKSMSIFIFLEPAKNVDDSCAGLTFFSNKISVSPLIYNLTQTACFNKKYINTRRETAFIKKLH